MSTNNTDLPIIEVAEVYGANTANRFLQCEWRLLNTVAGKDEQGFPLTSYVLGKTTNSKERPDI